MLDYSFYRKERQKLKGSTGRQRFLLKISQHAKKKNSPSSMVDGLNYMRLQDKTLYAEKLRSNIHK